LEWVPWRLLSPAHPMLGRSASCGGPKNECCSARRECLR
jgi:hypothetical protein